ncbi:MAG: ABC transporter permease, partial [Candidatus Acidiferrales bacterium]
AVPVAWGTSRLLSLVIRSARGFDKFPTVGADYFLLLVAVEITLAAGCLAATGTSLWIGAKRASVSLRETNHTVAPRSRNWIIGLEVAVSIALVMAAIVSVVGFQTLSNQSGFDGQAVTAQFTGGFFNPELDRILSRIRGSPGVQAVATASALPLSGSRAMTTVKADSSSRGVRELHVWIIIVDLHYFSAIGTKIVRGRDFQSGDRGGQVCILSANAASTLFPEEEPLGKPLRDPACLVIGVAEDAHFRSMSEPADAVIYRLVRRTLPSIIVRAATSGLAIQAVRNAAQDKFRSIEPIEVSVDKDLRLWKLVTISGTLCAVLAGIILAVGFFGILSLQVAERRREVGVRIALGGSVARVSFALLTKLGPAVIIGLACGSAGALPAAAKLAELYHLNFQVVIACYLGSVVLLGLLMLAAVAAPLGRALAISPVECLAVE